MRILVVSAHFLPENFRVNDLVAGLTARGHEVVVLTGLPNYPAGRFFPGYGLRGPYRETLLGAQVFRVPLVPRGGGGALRLLANYASYEALASLRALGPLGDRFDAIFVSASSPITTALPAIAARARFGAPLLLWVLDLWPESLSAAGPVQHPAALKAVGAVVRWIYARSDRVLVPSQAFFPRVARYGAGAEKVRYFPNWVEPEYLAEPAPAVTPAPPLRPGFRVVFAGNLGAAQDLPAVLSAIEAAKASPAIQWIFAGDGRMGAFLRAEVAKRGLEDRVQLLGQLPPSAMPALFAAADALLVSLRREEIFALTVPGKVQSYLSSGRPVLAMLDGEGARLVEEAGAGLTVPAGDGAGLARQAQALAAMPLDARARMGENGRRYAREHFDRDRLFDQLVSWMQQAAEERCKQRN